MREIAMRILRFILAASLLSGHSWLFPVAAAKVIKDSTAEKDKAASTPSPKPYALDSRNYDSHVGDGNVWLIEFYTPWCRHCQSFSPSYSNIAASFHSSPSEKIRVAKVDASVERALLARFGVSSFPSFFLVDGWSVYEFEGNRNEVSLMDFARGGYKKNKPLPFWSSPMGPMGILQGSLVFMGSWLMGFFRRLQTSYNVSPIVAGMILCGVGVTMGLLSVIFFAIMTTPKFKQD